MMSSSIPQSSAVKASGGGILRAGLLAIVAAVAGNLVVWAVARAVLDISADFLPLAGPAPAVMFTVFGVAAATGVFALINRIARRPRQVFLVVAVVALLLSFVPNIALLSSSQPGVSVPAVGTLMLMHVVAAVASVALLTRAAGPDA